MSLPVMFCCTDYYRRRNRTFSFSPKDRCRNCMMPHRFASSSSSLTGCINCVCGFGNLFAYLQNGIPIRWKVDFLYNDSWLQIELELKIRNISPRCWQVALPFRRALYKIINRNKHCWGRFPYRNVRFGIVSAQKMFFCLYNNHLRCRT